jgi:hypothetical protein
MGPAGERRLSAAERAWAERLPFHLRRRSAVRVVAWTGIVLTAVGSTVVVLTSDVIATTVLGLAVAVPGMAGVIHGFWAGKPWWRGAAGLLATGLCAISVLGVALGHDPFEGAEALTLHGFLALGLMGWGHAVTVLCGTRRAIPQRALHEDLRRGMALEFEGARPRAPSVLAGRRRMTALKTGEPNIVQKTAILPGTSLVVSLDGHPVDRFLQAHPVDVAVPRCHALRVPLPNSSFDDGRSGVRRLCKRTLSPDERKELREHARRLRRIEPTWALLVLGALGFAILEADEPPGNPWRLDLLFWMSLVMGAVAAHTRRWIAAWRLDRDARLRWVATVDGPNSPEARAPALEILPLSHVAWTENGQPASWRFNRD